MSQSDTTVSTRFSLLPGSITRFFLLLIIVLLVTMGVMVQSAVNAWLKDKSYQIVDITHAIHNAWIPGGMLPGKFMTTSPRPLRHRQVKDFRNASEAGCVLS